MHWCPWLPSRRLKNRLQHAGSRGHARRCGLQALVAGIKRQRGADCKAKRGRPQLSIQRLCVKAELESLLRLAPVIDAITVDSPVLLLTHLGDGRYDIDDILDKLKQLPKSLALDITGKVRDFKLPAVSLHAVKNSAHGIKRGKLSSIDVNYVVLLNARLTARIRLVLK